MDLSMQLYYYTKVVVSVCLSVLKIKVLYKVKVVGCPKYN